MESQIAFHKVFTNAVGRIISIGFLQPTRHVDRPNLFWIAFAAFVLCMCTRRAQADIYEWEWIDPADHDLGKIPSTTICPGGAGVSAIPFANLSSRNLTQAYLIGANLSFANLGSSTLTSADLKGANLTGAKMPYSDLTDADFTDAIVRQTAFYYSNISAEQLYSTASYQSNDLYGISLSGNSNQVADLAGWNFSNQDLTRAGFTNSNLTATVFTGATVSQANFSDSNLTAEQLYSTNSYQTNDLHGMYLDGNNLAGWDFAAQNLTGTDMRWTTLNGANFLGADVSAARFNGSNLAAEQFYSTASYQSGNLQDVALPNDVSGWDFTGQNLTHAGFAFGTLTDASFAGAIIAKAEFSYSNLTASQLYSTASYQAGDLQGLLLRDRDLSGWDLSGQNLSSGLYQGSTLRHASFAGANLTSTGLYDCDLIGTDFSGATLAGANFSRSDLRGATVGSLASAITTRTIMPDGSVSELGQPVRNCDQDIPIHVLGGISLDSNSGLSFILDDQPWNSTVSCVPGTFARLAGVLVLDFDQSIPPSNFIGRTYQLFDWSQVGPSGEFDTVAVWGLPYGVDTSRLYTMGEITILPEPSAFVLLGLAGFAVLANVRQRRRRAD